MTRKQCILAAVALFVSCAAIALFPPGPLIRGTAGDVLVTALLYFACRAALARRFPNPVLAGGVLGFAFLVEASQAVGLRSMLGIRPHSVIGIVLGGTFDWFDCAAYAAGTAAALALDAIAERHGNRARNSQIQEAGP